MLGRQFSQQNSCESIPPPGIGNDERYKRDIFTDMKIAIDCLKSFNESLLSLHPDVIYKIRTLI